MSTNPHALAKQICDGLIVHGFENDAGAETVIRQHEPLIAKLLMRSAEKRSTSVDKVALEKAWFDHADERSGWSGTIPDWFSDAIKAYVETAKPTIVKAHPLSEVADALECFWNASLGSARESQDSTALAIAGSLSEGFAAIAARLREGTSERCDECGLPIAWCNDKASLAMADKEIERLNRKAQQAESVPTIDLDDLQLLLQLNRDYQHDGARKVIEKDASAWAQAFRLSDAGLIAIEQIAIGGVLHITRLGGKAITAALADASQCEAKPDTYADERRESIYRGARRADKKFRL